ncbi:MULTISPECIES: YicS family protein [Serratia]|uniref:YicS family protein n=1 Tax=Serratia TaxID=613 RepID=UPI001F5C6E04|nr:MULTISPECIES: YicS family protein [Serratia]CAI0996217.1 Uncharacterised protein [Serratia ficaria]CAI1586725.1 Uncharacterised protein [Serratia ficaria]CAI1691950.1 Uncharacterised protein [Serratia ficaria]CAI2031060.1 Uncharacterised protein [Serratia ficaria]CAI2418890.1 Uncharacterised protein [Serratia ficaria]
MAASRKLLLWVCLLASGNALAESALQSLQFEQHKQQVMAELKKVCRQQAGTSDNDWANKILSVGDNKQHIREATVAIERKNEKNYRDALAKVQCPAS